MEVISPVSAVGCFEPGNLFSEIDRSRWFLINGETRKGTMTVIVLFCLMHVLRFC
jgi:hypothetical protein